MIMSPMLLVSVFIFGGFIFFLIHTYNRLVRLFALVQEAWSGISVQLKRRYDLVPNLVEVVKGYANHESTLFENVTKARTAAMHAQTITEKAGAEEGFTGALKSLFAVAENYPELKANVNFLELQATLHTIETELQLARRYYNGAVRNFNIKTQLFPSSIIASLTGFSKQPYFEIDSVETVNPSIKF